MRNSDPEEMEDVNHPSAPKTVTLGHMARLAHQAEMAREGSR